MVFSLRESFSFCITERKASITYEKYSQALSSLSILSLSVGRDRIRRLSISVNEESGDAFARRSISILEPAQNVSKYDISFLSSETTVICVYQISINIALSVFCSLFSIIFGRITGVGTIDITFFLRLETIDRKILYSLARV